jgi:hypothetical protein
VVLVVAVRLNQTSKPPLLVLQMKVFLVELETLLLLAHGVSLLVVLAVVVAVRGQSAVAVTLLLVMAVQVFHHQ